MDLTVNIDGTKLKIRVAGIVSTSMGFLFEKSDKNYIFPIGGKIMINETSQEAIIREIEEEIGMHVNSPVLIAVIENLYGFHEEKVHEICFVYKIETIFKGVVPNGFIEVSKENLHKFEILPDPITDILEKSSEQCCHIINRR
jgi:8-oxo-dGTP pyrophosphatase MutT (NUDIX family)